MKYLEHTYNQQRTKVTYIQTGHSWPLVARKGSVAGVVGTELYLSERTIDKSKGEALQLMISSVVQLYCII